MNVTITNTSGRALTVSPDKCGEPMQLPKGAVVVVDVETVRAYGRELERLWDRGRVDVRDDAPAPEPFEPVVVEPVVVEPVVVEPVVVEPVVVEPVPETPEV